MGDEEDGSRTATHGRAARRPAWTRWSGRLALGAGAAGLVAVWSLAAGAVARLLSPPGTAVCPLAWPPFPACAPGLHVVVAVLATLLVVAVTVAVAVQLRREAAEPDVVVLLGLVVVTVLVAVILTARPRPVFALLLGLGVG